MHEELKQVYENIKNEYERRQSEDSYKSQLRQIIRTLESLFNIQEIKLEE